MRLASQWSNVSIFSIQQKKKKEMCCVTLPSHFLIVKWYDQSLTVILNVNVNPLNFFVNLTYKGATLNIKFKKLSKAICLKSAYIH